MEKNLMNKNTFRAVVIEKNTTGAFSQSIKQKKIVSELKNIFSNNVKKNSYTKKHAADITGNSSNTTTQFEFKSKDVVRVSCYDWGKQIEDERGYTDNLRVTIIEANFRNWVNTKAHE